MVDPVNVESLTAVVRVISFVFCVAVMPSLPMILRNSRLPVLRAENTLDPVAPRFVPPPTLPLNVFQSVEVRSPVRLVEAVAIEIATPDPITAPVPPVTETPVVAVVIFPIVKAFCFPLNVFQSVLVRSPEVLVLAVETERETPDPIIAPVPPVTESSVVEDEIFPMVKALCLPLNVFQSVDDRYPSVLVVD
jgi:hypothetical protein